MTGWKRHPDRAVTLFLAVATYVPMLLTRPGQVSADTKTYLTLDPGAVLGQAATMWDPSVGAGSVPHQNIGYLFPLGPYYWLMERLAVPDWLTQRLLWATMVFAAAVGTYRLARWLGWRVGGSVVAATFYAFSPYLLSYLARLSVILAPWAAMPWMILLAAKAARTRRWRPAAAFALVVALVGSVNATSLVFAGLAPVLWLVADVVSGRVAARAAGAAVLRIGVLTAGVSAWWIAGLSVQGAYGIPILRYTESYQAVASASTPNEILRGLGYWFFYGGDRLDPWVGPSLPYTNNPFLMTLGFTLAGLALLGLLTRFAGRAFAVLLLLAGLTVAVGAAPLGDSTVYGSLFERLATDTTIGQALRSTPRAAPLVILALAFGAGAGAEWLRARLAASPQRRFADLVPVAAVALVAVQLFPWFTGTALTSSLLRAETLPAYETELAAWLDSNGTGRVYELPGADFANYRWGGTVDPVLPGLIDRPYLARELVPLGGAGTADLLNAFERRLAEGWFEPESLAPIARLFDAATIVTRNDLEHERYRLARPGPLWSDIVGVLGAPDHAGPPTTDRTAIPLVDELTLARPDAATSFPTVAAFDVAESATISLVSAAAPVIVAGDGDGLVDLAGAGLLHTDLVAAGRPVLYTATLNQLAVDGDLDPAALGSEPWWIVTDTNRKQGRHWSTIGSNRGALESVGPLWLNDDPGDNELDVFGHRLADQTIAVHRGDVADVRASYYGNLITYTAEDAPHFAIDGDPTTAWRAGVFDETAGLRWEVDFRDTVDPGAVTLLQPTTGATNRFITEARIILDGGDQDGFTLDVALDDRSRGLPGQTVALPAGTFTAMTIEVLADNVGPLGSYAGQPGVGLAEVTLPGVTDDRVAQLPDLAATTLVPDGVAAEQRLTYVMTRQRIDPATPNRTAPEPKLDRLFATATERPFGLTGEVRLSASADDALLATVLGDGELAVADRRLPGAPLARGASARDGDERTAWQTPFGDSTGATLTIRHRTPIAADEITIAWLDDGNHSAPVTVTVTNDMGDTRDLTLLADRTDDGVATATIAIPNYTASTSTVTVTTIEAGTTPEYFSGVPQMLPIGIAEIAFPGEQRPVQPATIDTGCLDDLLEIDGEAIPVRITGEVDHALARNELQLAACRELLIIGSGAHLLRAEHGASTGFDIDRLVLDSMVPAATPAVPVPAIDVDERSATRLDVAIGSTTGDAWLTLNQSWNAGWRATIDGTDLGPPVLIDGYANGWLIPPAVEARTVELEWTPQRRVRIGVWLSALAALAVGALLAWPRRKATSDPTSGRRLLDPNGIPLAAGLVVVLFLVGGAPAAAAAALTVAVAERWPRLPVAIVLVSGVVASAPVVVLEQVQNFADGPDWPSQFGWAAPFAWIAVATVAASALVARPPADAGSGG